MHEEGRGGGGNRWSGRRVDTAPSPAMSEVRVQVHNASRRIVRKPGVGARQHLVCVLQGTLNSSFLLPLPVVILTFLLDKHFSISPTAPFSCRRQICTSKFIFAVDARPFILFANKKDIRLVEVEAGKSSPKTTIVVKVNNAELRGDSFHVPHAGPFCRVWRTLLPSTSFSRRTWSAGPRSRPRSSGAQKLIPERKERWKW